MPRPSAKDGPSVRGHHPLRSNRQAVLLAYVAVVAIGYGAYGFYDRFRATAGTYRPDPAAVAADAVAEPNEAEVDRAAPYAVAADLPRRVAIPSIGVDALIQRVTVNRDGEMAVPANVGMAGWYANGPRPGEEGVSVINAHLQGRYRDGAFKRLGNVREGDEVTVEFGDLSVRRFRVVGVGSYGVDEASRRLFAPHGELNAQLTLITCGGIFDRDKGTFQERVIVVAEPVQSFLPR